MKSKFHAGAVGPEGGAVHKQGVNRAEVTLRHDDLNLHLEVIGSLVGEVPHALIRAWSLADSPGPQVWSMRDRTFFSGPLSEIFALPDLQKASRAIVQAYYNGDHRELDDAAETLRALLGWDTFTLGNDSVDSETCDECAGKGWEIFNEDPDDGYLGDVQACDTCKQLPDDATAADLARSLGFLVTARNDRFEVDALPTTPPDIR